MLALLQCGFIHSTEHDTSFMTWFLGKIIGRAAFPTSYFNSQNTGLVYQRKRGWMKNTLKLYILVYLKAMHSVCLKGTNTPIPCL